MQGWEQKRIKEYLDQKIPAIEKLLNHFQEDESSLTLRARHFDKNSAYNVELTLQIPSHAFVGTEASHTIEKAIDLAKDRLVKQLKKHEEVMKSKGKGKVGQRDISREGGAARTHRGIKKVKQIQSVPVEEFVDI